MNDIQGRFILDWHQATKQPIELEQFLHRTETHFGTVPIQIVASGPNSTTQHLKNMYISLIMSALLYICSLEDS